MPELLAAPGINGASVHQPASIYNQFDLLALGGAQTGEPAERDVGQEQTLTEP
jgi:hypothetical protein